MQFEYAQTGTFFRYDGQEIDWWSIYQDRFQERNWTDLFSFEIFVRTYCVIAWNVFIFFFNKTKQLLLYFKTSVYIIDVI